MESFKLAVYVVQDGDTAKNNICILISFSYDDVTLSKRLKAIVIVQFGLCRYRLAINFFSSL